MISFQELFEKSRKDFKVPNRMLCLDPGETSGWAYFRGTELVSSGQIRTVNDGKIDWDALTELLDNHLIARLVCEDYRIYEHKLTRHTFSPVLTLRLIGGIEYYANINELPITYQMAAQAKGFVTDAKLKTWGLYQEGMRHSRDAIRHGIYYLLFGK
jgi:hypothetical protein